MDKINELLLEFADRFRLDGDLLRCTSCNRGIIASRQDEDFVHAADCKLRMIGGRPWAALQAILVGPVVDAMHAYRAEMATMKAKLAALAVAWDAYLNSEDEDRVAEWIALCEAFSAAKAAP